MSLKTKYNTRLKALYRMYGRRTNEALMDVPMGKERQHLLDEKAALALCIAIFREDPEYVMRMIKTPSEAKEVG